MTKFDNFINAFSIGGSSSYEKCICNNIYYNDDISDEEFESLSGDRILKVDEPIKRISFQGNEYVLNCDCWNHDAIKFMALVDNHNFQIAEYLNSERKRKIELANSLPIVSQD